MELPTLEKRTDPLPLAETHAEKTPPRTWGVFEAFRRLRMFEAIGFREFRLLWLGQIFTGMGTWMDQVARGWLIYELTNSKVQLGLVRGVQAIPILLLSPIAGSTADRFDRKTQILVAQVLDGLMYAAVALFIFTGNILPWHVYVTAFAKSIVQTFQQPSRAAMVADAVPASHLTNAIGLNSIVFNVSRSTGPALAGLLIAMFGTGASYAVQAVFFLLATVFTLQLRPTQRSSEGRRGLASGKGSFGKSIIEGWKFSWRNENVRLGLVITGFASLFIIPFSTLLPVFARDILNVGATGQGLLLTAMGIGALCSAVLIASVGDKLPRGIVMLGGVAMYGLSVVVFSASPWFKLSMVLMMFVGLFHVSSHALVQTVIQSYSPSEFRGRTMAVYHQSHFIHTMGSVLIGILASLWGAQEAMASMAALGTLSMFLIFVTMPQTRSIR